MKTDIQEKKEDVVNYVHGRSIRQIAKDIANKKEEPIKNEKLDEVKEEADKITKTKKEEKQKEREQRDEERLKKISEETATKVAEETKKAFDDKVKEILNKDTPDIDKQKELDELIPIWEKEERLPTDYKELIAENLRVTEAKWEQKERDKKEREEQETKSRQETERVEKEKEQENTKKAEEEKFKNFQQAIVADLNDLYDANLLPRPSTVEEINNEATTDEKAKETQKLLKFAVELNTKLRAEGKTPISSVAKIYFLHYKPSLEGKPKDDQPAGNDAPISGASNAPSGETTKINLGRLRNETWAQTKFRIARENLKKMITR